eukprot:6467778-Amphidinium_carterae.1
MATVPAAPLLDTSQAAVERVIAQVHVSMPIDSPLVLLIVALTFERAFQYRAVRQSPSATCASEACGEITAGKSLVTVINRRIKDLLALCSIREPP